MTSPHLKGILFAITGFTLWVLNDTFIKLVAEAAIPPTEIAAVMCFTGVIFLVIKTFLRKKLHRLRPRHFRKQLIIGLLYVSGFFTCIVALKHLPFIMFYIAVFTAPMMISLMAAFLLKEHLTRGKIAAIATGFAGVIIATDPFSTHAANMQGDWIGYGTIAVNILGFATTVVLQRHMTKSETEESVAFMQMMVPTVVFGIVTLFVNTSFSLTILLMLCTGGVLAVLGNFCNILATKNTTAATVAQFHYTQIISGAAIGFLVWHEVPTPTLITGSLIIVASGIYIANHMRKADIEAANQNPLTPVTADLSDT